MTCAKQLHNADDVFLEAVTIIQINDLMVLLIIIDNDDYDDDDV